MTPERIKAIDNAKGPGCWPVGFENTVIERIKQARRDQMERDCMAVDGCRVAAPIESKMTLVDAVDAIRRAFEEQTK